MLKAGSAHATVRTGGVSAAVQMRIVSPKRTDAATTIAGVQVRVVDNKIYVQDPDDKGQWALLDENTQNPDGQELYSLATDVTDNSPVDGEEMPEDGKIVFVGQEERGAHYRQTIPLRSFAKMMLKDPDQTGEDRRAMRRVAARAGDEVLTQQVWLDPQDRVVQLEVDLDPLKRAMNAPDDIDLNSRVDFARWGAPVTITAPPASQVAPFDRLYGTEGEPSEDESAS